MTAEVAIVIVTYNSAGQIVPCLRSLFEQRRGVAQQVIVVDNDSQDDTVSIVRREYPDVELVLPGVNLGFAKGVNLGARHARAEFLLLLNPDTEILDHAVDSIVGFARKYPAYGLFGGRAFKPDGRLEPSSCWGTPSLWSMALFALGITTLARGNPLLDPESLGSWPRNTIREVGIVTGCFLLVPMKIWSELGGMDERYFMYGEDADFSMRARQRGFRPVIYPDAKIVHGIGKSSGTPDHKMMLLYRGKASLVRRHWTGLGRFLGLLFLAMGTGLRAKGELVTSFLFGRKTKGRWEPLWRGRKEWLRGYEADRDS